MKILRVTLFLAFLSLSVSAQSVYVRLITNKGNIILRLYDETPKHRDMFLKSIKEGVYRDALFNRVIKSFVSQGGELDDSILNQEKRHPEIPGKRLAAEIKPGLYHKKGALGAGRDDNKEKSSYYNQIYLVDGKPQTDAQLDAIELKKGIKYTAKQREIYKTEGGIPRLDQDYTIFGEIVEGMDIADQINSVATDKNDVPLSPVVFKAVVLSKKEAVRLKLNP
ncbi:peptidylprolyl isomerase [Pedobacter metabolipauper]|uniref:peptidylprolyl isomerase n=1 Tax=Pedobacter metabolipauper TaxID=425513 RepID=A0A4R6T0G9_9SPHI|nr:peptidylprolyl isomerase [Pedobacter metabolipauper]TDQ11877.1 peptidyl-prolyl cis-trans isomerase B (cyclophilin B) [Pedobacter metabolipauper]